MPYSAVYDEEGDGHVPVVMFKSLSCHRLRHKLNWQHGAPTYRCPEGVDDLVVEPFPTV